jgi:hypothetical protein
MLTNRNRRRRKTDIIPSFSIKHDASRKAAQNTSKKGGFHEINGLPAGLTEGRKSEEKRADLRLRTGIEWANGRKDGDKREDGSRFE